MNLYSCHEGGNFSGYPAHILNFFFLVEQPDDDQVGEKKKQQLQINVDLRYFYDDLEKLLSNNKRHETDGATKKK